MYFIAIQLCDHGIGLVKAKRQIEGEHDQAKKKRDRNGVAVADDSNEEWNELDTMSYKIGDLVNHLDTQNQTKKKKKGKCK